MKLYTKRGDAGETDLFGNIRVPKDALRVEAYGSVDELNSVIGLALAAVAPDQSYARLRAVLLESQHRLFELGADLASPRTGDASKEDTGYIPRISNEQVHAVENQIDELTDPVPPMKSFVLPGGTELAARLHHARTVCRRAERLCVTLNKNEPLGDPLLIYLNRLSDLLFAAARHANHLAQVQDIPWHPQKR